MLHRRTLLAAAPALLAAPALRAQDANWPNRTIRLVVPFTPAGTTDIAARILAERLTHRLGQHVVVENRAGAGGNVGSDFVAKSEPDGYTLLMATVSSGGINYSLYGSRMPYKPEDLAACGLMLQVPNLIFVTNSLPVRTLKELVDYARANPGKLNNGSSGAGTSLHLTGELLKTVAGIQMQHVPFRGAGPMLQEVIAGRIEVAVDNLPSVIGHIRDGRLRPLAVTTKQRTPALPDVPTTAEAGFPDVEATAWFGIQVPARTPRPIIERLGREIDAAVKEPETKAKIADLGGMPPGLTPDGGTSPETFEAFIKAEIAKWGEVVRKSGATVE
ncbi:tripartite tricarboxylate transporter substrate binding protein [Siccirubricoccus sp. KC 17139]|uniref:Tripartite tricarboxylate transporter substrate binding protein n=1 Tax=Siccirubricoccus soli TaxID=2899147 RepID=A0ABT1CZ39_9PROT|nr:tripartite tricarboxylate transporter substrate binding protein [Siccirubricoccus soli]MCO6414933.1 tripartite tricarboxylate transporter substrate binding protein [Siccirubricoccus soli]MCP2681064.1 tripartite tricarboxylate transporter substrate binding protein [Siccirubricoccus soli]